MKILHILKRTPDETITRIIEEHRKRGDLNVIDLRQEQDYAYIIRLIASSDAVLCW